MGQIDVGGILHHQNHGRAISLFPGLVQVRLHQGRKRDIWLIAQTIQGFGLFPGLHLSRQGSQGVLRKRGFPLGPLVSFDADHAVGHPQRFARPTVGDPILLVCSSCYCSTLLNVGKNQPF
jgi:hypothetical protein